MAGGTGHVDLRFGDFFDSVFKRHQKGEAAELFSCGGPSTTPHLADISREWPHPWLYSRVFLVLFATLSCLWFVAYLVTSVGGVTDYAGYGASGCR